MAYELVNSSLNSTLETTNQALTYEATTAVTNDPLFLIALGVVWFLPLFLYLLIASVVHGRTSSGARLPHPMIYYANAYYPFLVWGLVQLALFLFIVFPIWIRVVGG